MARDLRERELVWAAESRRIRVENQLMVTRGRLDACMALLDKLQTSMSSELSKYLAREIAYKMAAPIIRAVQTAMAKVKDRRELVSISVPLEDLIMHDPSEMPRAVLDRWLSSQPVKVDFSLADRPDDGVTAQVIRTHVELPSLHFNYDKLADAPRRVA